MINAAHGTLPIRYYNQIRLWLRSAAPVKSATEIIYNTQGKKALLCSLTAPPVLRALPGT